jgi:hypothetical protein
MDWIYLFVVSSAMTLFIPTVMSAWTQPFPITIIMFLASLSSTGYHYYYEKKFSELDVTWASITTLSTLIMLILLSLQFGVRSRRVLTPLFFMLIAIVIFVTKASLPNVHTEQENNDEYGLWHGIWHILTSLSAISILRYKINYMYILHPLAELYKKF